MNSHFEEKKEYKYLRFAENNHLISSGITKGLTINQYGEFWHHFTFNEETYDIQGQILGNMIIFLLKDLSKMVIYLNNIPEEYREYKFEVGKNYSDGLTECECIGIFTHYDDKIACFVNVIDPDEFHIGRIKKMENCEVCETEYNEFRADEQV